ncbi:MAG: hypothetical protein CME65_16025 [Halobacteriovoraceae bacterium]|nr:hypothetical protein [Halobacteriovoraceae bacterium]|tara:strand:+ start:278 stop:1669 length:1392 start_codon:yes stop_codon:yes gene_type:complete
MKAIKFLLLLSLITTVACTRKSKKDSKEDDSFVEAPAIEIENPQEEDNGQDSSADSTTNFEPVLVAEQNFEEFSSGGNWSLVDFGLNHNSAKDDYQDQDKLLFNIEWTARTRKLMADRLGYERSEMTRDFANSICAPKLEVGKESVYTSGNSQNRIAELDSDLGHCGVNGNEPAAVSLSSFIKTEIGYRYKVQLRYQMRKYGQMTDKSYRDLVVRFGSSFEKFDPVFDAFEIVELEMTAIHKYSKLVLRDNGLPNSHGILIDDIKIFNLGPVDDYQICSEKFRKNSRGFKKCVIGEIDTDKNCDLDETAIVKATKGESVASNRRDTSNIFTQEAAQNGKINFFSIGIKGKLILSCQLDGQAGLMEIENKTLSFQEISWNNVNAQSYPEVVKVIVKLQDCYEEELNRTQSIGTVKTSEAFNYTFDQDDEDRSYTGCRLDKLVIKDITPNGPSKDGFDINSLQLN